MFLSSASLGLRAFGGVTCVIQGGKFQSGFLAAGFSEFAGPHIDKMSIGVLGKGIASSMVGGVASKLGGGKFESGAITSAFSYMYNACLHGQCDGTFTGGLSAAQEQWLYDNFPPYKYGACIGALFSGYSSCTNGDMLAAAAGTMGVAGSAMGVPYAGRLTLLSGGDATSPKMSPNFESPTNSPQLPPDSIPSGWRIREMGPTEQYQNGYWKLEKLMNNGGWQPIDPSTMKPGTRPETHIPFPGK